LRRAAVSKLGRGRVVARMDRLFFYRYLKDPSKSGRSSIIRKRAAERRRSIGSDGATPREKPAKKMGGREEPTTLKGN